MWSIRKRVFIDRRMEEVHRFATNPTHWYQWYAGLSEAENLLGKGEKGTSLDLRYFFFGRDFSMHVLVEENAPIEDGFVWRCLVTGTIEATQTWTYKAKNGGTEILFKMDYELHGNILGVMANTLYLNKLMSNSIEQTLQNLKDISEGD